MNLTGRSVTEAQDRCLPREMFKRIWPPRGVLARHPRIALVGAAGALSLVLASCATTYGPMGVNGGYRGFQESKTSYYVYFLANSNTSDMTAFRFFLTRAAQIALHRGYKYFYVYHLKHSGRSQVYVTPGAAQVYIYRSPIPGFPGHEGFLDPHFIGGRISFFQPPVYNTVTEPGYRGQIVLVRKRLKGQPPPFDANILYRGGMQLSRTIKAQNVRTGVITGVGTVAIIGVVAAAVFFGTGGTVSFGHASF